MKKINDGATIKIIGDESKDNIESLLQEREKLIKGQKNLFKYKNRNMKESEIINCEEKFLQEPKDNIFKRIFKRVKCIFKLKN